MTSRPAAVQHLHDPAVLHRVRDWIDREYAQPLNVEALAGGVHISARHLRREFRRVYGESPYGVRDCAVRDRAATWSGSRSCAEPSGGGVRNG